MKNLVFGALFMAALLCPLKAQAQIQSYVMFSSCTYSQALVSSGTWVRQVDNLDNGAVLTMKGRTMVRLTLPVSTSAGVWVAYDNLFSTAATSVNFGRFLSTGVNEFPVNSQVPIFALAGDSLGNSTVKLNLEQCSPMRQAGQ